MNNVHATGLVLRDRGLLITGPSGSGKTQLALSLLRQAHAARQFARLVADDQILLAAHDRRLMMSAPHSILGLVEVRGIGPVCASATPRAIVDLVVALIPAAESKRLPDPQYFRFDGLTVPALHLPANDILSCTVAIAAQFALLPF